jgi:hydrogenase maturation protein HypF
VRDLEKAGFEVYTHQMLPANDGCIALGQAVVAAARLLQARGTWTEDKG